jgi:hypothetical protein
MNRVDICAHYDSACGISPAPLPPSQGDDVTITANDIVKAEESPGDKFVLMLNGKLRPIGQVELRVLGIPLTLELGKPVNAADRAALGAYNDAPPAVITGHISADLGDKGHITGSVG